MLLNLAMATGIILVGLAAIEAYLRWRGTFEVAATPGCYAFSDNPRIMYEMKPHCGDTNAWGMRDIEVDPTAPADRIAVVGDSVTYGPGVALDETWPKRLQRLMTQAGAPTTVLNFAVQGYSTVQEVETLRTKAMAFRPRIALLQYCFNDEAVYTTIFETMLDERRREQGGAGVDALDPRHGWLMRRLLFSRIAIAVRIVLARLVPAPTPGATSDNVINAYYREHNPVREGLLALRDIASANGLRTLVLIFPHAWGARADRIGHTPLPELTAYPDGWVFDNRRVLDLCRELGVTCVDLTARFHADPRLRRIAGHRIFSDGCCHLTLLGHKLMAWIVFQEIRARGWLTVETPRPAIDASRGARRP